MEGRYEMEEWVGRTLAGLTGKSVEPEDVVLDLPENISFETSFPVWDKGERIDFTESGTVFLPEVVSRFIHTLRRIRLSVPQELFEALPAGEWREEFGL